MLPDMTWKPDSKRKPQKVITSCGVCGGEYTIELVCPDCIQKQKEYIDRQARAARYKQGLVKAGKKHAKELEIQRLIELERGRKERGHA